MLSPVFPFLFALLCIWILLGVYICQAGAVVLHMQRHSAEKQRVGGSLQLPMGEVGSALVV